MKKFNISGETVYAESIHDVVGHLKDRIDPDEQSVEITFKERKSDDECKELAKKFKVRFIMNLVRGKAQFMGDKRDLDKLINFVKPETVNVERYQVVIDDSKVNDEEECIYEVATAKVRGGRMNHEYFSTKEELLKKYRGKDNGSVVKLEGFLGPFYNGMKNGKKVWRYEDQNSYYDSKTKDAEYIKVGGKQVEVLEALPNGWRVDRDATTAPRGYVWINNNKSRFGGERKSALIREELVDSVNTETMYSLTPKERFKFVSELTKALQRDFGYSHEEANEIAIKRANALGEDWRSRWGGDIMKQVKQELKYTARKGEDSLPERSALKDRVPEVLVGRNYNLKKMMDIVETAREYRLELQVPEIYIKGDEEKIREWLSDIGCPEKQIEKALQTGTI